MLIFTRIYFQINLGTSANAGKARQALKSIQGLDTRKYKPRKFDELFKNCTLKDRRLKKEDLSVTETKNVIKKHHYINEGGEETMTETRNYTPFDGKQNDWISFARQQAEFYRNAEQYITNIQLDIDELDDEIEDIIDVQPANDSTDIFEADAEQEEIHVVKNINEMAG